MTASGKLTSFVRTLVSDTVSGFLEITHNSFALLGLRLHHEDLVQDQDHRGAGDEDHRIACVLGFHADQWSWPGLAAGAEGGAEEGVAAGSGVGAAVFVGAEVASLVSADFTSSSKRSQSRSAVPMRAMNT